MLDEIACASAAALLVGAALAFVARRVGLTVERSIAAAASAGALTALVVIEVADADVAGWLQRHPVATAVGTGGLLLAVTVLFVEAFAERSLTAAQERRWRDAGHVAAAGMLAGLVDPIRDFQDGIVWRMGEAIEKPASSHPNDDAAERARAFAADVRRVVLSGASVMSATPQLHGIYAHALTVAKLAIELATSIGDWERESARDIDVPPFSESARLSWWEGVGMRWLRLVHAARSFEDAVNNQLNTGVDTEPWEPPWREVPSEPYRRSLRDYVEEFGLDEDRVLLGPE